MGSFYLRRASSSTKNSVLIKESLNALKTSELEDLLKFVEKVIEDKKTKENKIKS